MTLDPGEPHYQVRMSRGENVMNHNLGSEHAWLKPETMLMHGSMMPNRLSMMFGLNVSMCLTGWGKTCHDDWDCVKGNVLPREIL